MLFVAPSQARACEDRIVRASIRDMAKSLTISRLIPAPKPIVERYLASPGGLMRIINAQNIRRLPPRGSRLAEHFQLHSVDGLGPSASDTTGPSGVPGSSNAPPPPTASSLDATLAKVTLSGALASPRVAQAAERAVARLAMDCTRLCEYATPPAKILVTGASGLIGSSLLPLLVGAGHEVTRLVRAGSASPHRAESLLGTSAIAWQPQGQGTGALDPAVLDGVDIVIHLAGEPIGVGRWTKPKLAAIRDSRVEGTKLLARAMAQVARPPKLFVCASGIHAYGDRADEELTERSDIGSGYLAEVVRDWEAAADPARDAGVRVAHIRWGLVIAREGGALRAMLPLFRLGLGGIPAPGTQWWPWVSLDDALAQVLCILHSPSLHGPINGVAPQPATAAWFCRALARGVDRGLLARVPRWALAGVLGGQEEAVCTSTRAVPEALRTAHFRWEHPTLPDALAWELGTNAPSNAIPQA